MDRARLEAVLACVPAGVVVVDASTSEVVLANRQAEGILAPVELGVDAVVAFAEVRGRLEDGRPIAPDEWPLARTLATGEAVRETRLQLQRVDGGWMTIEASTSPVRDGSGGLSGVVAVFWDATDRERRDRIERRFVTNAAHQLQTPVAGIVSAVEVLMGGAKDDPDDRDRFLAHLERESQRLVRLARALLTLARAQVAAETMPVARVSLRPFLHEIAAAMRCAAGVELTVRCAATLALSTNRDLLEQAVGNLVSNAAQHTQRGRIVLAARRVDSGVAIEVSDTGPGLPDVDPEWLFDRFHRGDPHGADGFGLGLAIVREAVEALGGTVSIAPRPSGGTLARVVLPKTGTPAV